MKFITIAVLLITFPAAFTASRGADLLTVNGIAALVGNSVITREQVERYSLAAIQDFRTRYGNQPEVFVQRVNEARAASLERLIERRLILQEFEALKVNVPETFIEDSVDGEIEGEIARRYDGDRSLLTKSLNDQGLTMETHRREIREEIIEFIMRSRNVPRDILISPGRIERYYRENAERYQVNDQIRLRMIVLDKTRNPDAAALGREIIQKLDDGADFGEMASLYSDSEARQGGLWGWVDRKENRLREDIAEIAFQMPVGKRSDPIDKPEALYILLVEETKPAHTRPIDEVRDEIERILTTAERNRAEREWIDRLYKKTFVSRFWVIPTSQRATGP